jgi:hypothetical protein
MPAFLTLAHTVLCDALHGNVFPSFFFVPEISNKCAATRRVHKRKRIKNESEHNNARDRDMRAYKYVKRVYLFTCVSSSSACVGIKRTRGQRDRCVCWLLSRRYTSTVVCERERRYWRIIIIIKRYNPKVALNPLRPHLHHYIITYKSFREENFLCPSVEN